MSIDSSTVNWRWVWVTVAVFVAGVIFMVLAIAHLFHGFGNLLSGHPIKSLHQAVITLIDAAIAYGLLRLTIHSQKKIVVDH